MSRNKEVLNFEDTYAGISDEEEDAFNDETFGTGVAVGSDFNFGGDSSSSTKSSGLNYAQVAGSHKANVAYNDDQLKPIEGLWGQGSKDAISADELEAKLQSSVAQTQQQAQQQTQQQAQQQAEQQQAQQFPGGYPPLNMGYNFLPPGFIPPQGYGQFAVPPPQQFQQFQQFPPMDQLMIQQGQFPPQGVNVNAGQGIPQAGPQGQFQPPPGFQQLAPQPVQGQGQAQGQAPQQLQEPAPQETQPQLSGSQQGGTKVDLSDFPVLGSNEKRVQSQGHQHQRQQQQNQGQNQRSYRQRHHHHDNFDELPEEEKQRIIKRQQKVHRITQFCGIMTPRDKDFVSRVQLSQIVTDDPYIDDFYFQVHRLLKTGNAEVDNNSVAQSYLDLSGHRLGGRDQRAEVALQRMQQQVQKAVSYVKERAKNHPANGGRGNALGKTSTLGKTPRKQLEITLKSDVPVSTKSGRKSILLQIENIYQKVLELESAQRENKPLDVEGLWESLKLFEESDNMNFFIQILSFEKGLKIFPRIYGFLDRQQKLTIITLIFANLSLIKVVAESSFKNHKDDQIPAKVQRTIELFQHVVLKTIMVFLSYDTAITEIIGLLTILIEHNNVAFLATSRLGTSLITILLSRGEIIKQEQNVSSEDLKDWSNAYDKLFSSLETKLSLLFPSKSSNYDDSYIWQFFASLALSGKSNHQRIIVDEIRDEIFGSLAKAKESDDATKMMIISNLNLFLNVIGLTAKGEEIVELKEA